MVLPIWEGDHFPDTHANAGYFSFNFFSKPIYEKCIPVMFSSICLITHESYHFWHFLAICISYFIKCLFMTTLGHFPIRVLLILSWFVQTFYSQLSHTPPSRAHPPSCRWEIPVWILWWRSCWSQVPSTGPLKESGFCLDAGGEAARLLEFTVEIGANREDRAWGAADTMLVLGWTPDLEAVRWGGRLCCTHLCQLR